MQRCKEGLSLISNAHVVGYLTIGLDKLILVYLFLIRRLAQPSKTLLQILGQVHWTNVINLIVNPGSESEFLVLSGFTCLAALDLVVSLVLVVCLNKKIWQGLLPFLVIRGLQAFGLLVISICITIHVFKQTKKDGITYSICHFSF